MATLNEILSDKARRSQVVADCAQLVDEEVRGKSGLSGIAVKGAYAIVKKVKPNVVDDAVGRLLDPFAEQLDPFYQGFLREGINQPFAAYLVPRASEVANALLKITDERAERADNKALRSAYQKLRPTAVKHVEAAVPGIGRVIAKHI